MIVRHFSTFLTAVYKFNSLKLFKNLPKLAKLAYQKTPSSAIPQQRILQDSPKVINLRTILLALKKITRAYLLPQGFGPEAKSRGGIIVVRTYIQYIHSIHRKNLDLTKVSAQIVSGVVKNAHKWVSVGVIKFPVR